MNPNIFEARLEALIASLKKALFKSKSEKIDPAQYELELEDIETEPPLVCRRPRSKDTGSWERRRTEHLI